MKKICHKEGRAEGNIFAGGVKRKLLCKTQHRVCKEERRYVWKDTKEISEGENSTEHRTQAWE